MGVVSDWNQAQDACVSGERHNHYAVATRANISVILELLNVGTLIYSSHWGYKRSNGTNANYVQGIGAIH